jgi:hypothetical protein
MDNVFTAEKIFRQAQTSAGRRLGAVGQIGQARHPERRAVCERVGEVVAGNQSRMEESVTPHVEIGGRPVGGP